MHQSPTTKRIKRDDTSLIGSWEPLTSPPLSRLIWAEMDGNWHYHFGRAFLERQRSAQIKCFWKASKPRFSWHLVTNRCVRYTFAEKMGCLFVDGFVMWYNTWYKLDRISRKLPGAGQLYMQHNEKTVTRPVGGPGNSWDTVFPGRWCVYIASILDFLVYIHAYKGPGKIGHAPCESQRPWNPRPRKQTNYQSSHLQHTKVWQISKTLLWGIAVDECRATFWLGKNTTGAWWGLHALLWDARLSNSMEEQPKTIKKNHPCCPSCRCSPMATMMTAGPHQHRPPFDPALNHVCPASVLVVWCLSPGLWLQNHPWFQNHSATAKASLGSNLSNLAARLVLRCVGCGGGEFAAAAALLPLWWLQWLPWCSSFWHKDCDHSFRWDELKWSWTVGTMITVYFQNFDAPLPRRNARICAHMVDWGRVLTWERRASSITWETSSNMAVVWSQHSWEWHCAGPAYWESRDGGLSKCPAVDGSRVGFDVVHPCTSSKPTTGMHWR